MATLNKGGSRVQSKNNQPSASILERTIKFFKRYGIPIEVATYLYEKKQEINNIQDQVRLVIKDKSQQSLVSRELFTIASKSKSSPKIVADMYTQISPVLSELEYGNLEQIDLIQSLSYLFTASSAKKYEIDPVMAALSKSFENGKMSEKEFNIILKYKKEVLEILARGMGVEFSELLDLVKDGEVTNEKMFQSLAINNAKYLKSKVGNFTNLLDLKGRFDAQTMEYINKSFDDLYGKSRYNVRSALTSNNPHRPKDYTIDNPYEVQEKFLENEWKQAKNKADVAEAERKIEELTKEKNKTLSKQLQKFDIIKSRNKSKMKLAGEQFEVPIKITDETLNMSFIEPQSNEEVNFKMELIPTVESPKMSFLKSQAEETVNKIFDESYKIKEKAEKTADKILNKVKEKTVQQETSLEFTKKELDNKDNFQKNLNLNREFINLLINNPASSFHCKEKIDETKDSISDFILEQKNLSQSAIETFDNLKEAGDASQIYWENWMENMQNKLSNFNDMLANGINNFTNAFSNALFEIARGSQSVEDAFRTMLSNLVENTVRAISQMIAQYTALAAVKAMAGIPNLPTTLQANGGIFGSYLENPFSFGENNFIFEDKMQKNLAQLSIKLDKDFEEAELKNIYNSSRSTNVTQQINIRGNIDNRTANQIALETNRKFKKADRRLGDK